MFQIATPTFQFALEGSLPFTDHVWSLVNHNLDQMSH